MNALWRYESAADGQGGAKSLQETSLLTVDVGGTQFRPYGSVAFGKLESYKSRFQPKIARRSYHKTAMDSPAD